MGCYWLFWCEGMFVFALCGAPCCYWVGFLHLIHVRIGCDQASSMLLRGDDSNLMSWRRRGLLDCVQVRI